MSVSESPGKTGEMARFYLSIEGDALERAMLALNAVNIPTIAVTEAYYGNEPPADWKFHGLTAVLDADSSEVAQARVRDVLPDGYRVSIRAPLDPG